MLHIPANHILVVTLAGARMRHCGEFVHGLKTD
jgi:hypothetical protein